MRSPSERPSRSSHVQHSVLILSTCLLQLELRIHHSFLPRFIYETMKLQTQFFSLITLHCLGSVFAVPSADPADYGSDRIISRDVCVIGGGSAGTYAAVRLQQMGKSIVVVEKQGELGGHTNTYEDPETGQTYDYGVQIFTNRSVVRDYFDLLDVPLEGVDVTSAGISNPIDFSTGERVEVEAEDPTAGLQRYIEQLARYPFIAVGFDLPEEIPEDLLLPFGEFATKYDLGAAAVQIIVQVVQGVGKPLDLLTIYVMKYFNLEVAQGAATGFVRSANSNNSALYANARARFGADVLLDSQVIATRRSRGGADRGFNFVVVRTPSGIRLIKARKLVVAFPQKIEHFRGFDLDRRERDVFSKFESSVYYTTLLENTNLPEGTVLIATGADEQFNVPVIPGPNSVSPTGITGLFNLFYTSERPLPIDEVKETISEDILRLQNAGFDTTRPDFVEFEAHSPFQLVVSAEEIRNGFYGRFNGLQGYRDTFYTGAALSAHSSGVIWEFTEALLQEIAA